MENFPVERFSYNAKKGKFEPKKTSNKLFIKGPLPLPWITAANSLPGKAGAVGVAIWFLAGLQRTRNVKLTRQVEKIAACHRKAVYAAITNLEQAGLIRADRRRGSRSSVTILDATED